jgi:hypothetical protein
MFSPKSKFIYRKYKVLAQLRTTYNGLIACAEAIGEKCISFSFLPYMND